MVPVLYEILSMVRVKPCQVIRWHVPAIRRVWANDGLVDYFHIYNLNFFKDRCIFHVIVPSTDGDCLISDHWSEIERTQLFLESWIKLYISRSFFVQNWTIQNQWKQKVLPEALIFRGNISMQRRSGGGAVKDYYCRLWYGSFSYCSYWYISIGTIVGIYQ